MNYKSCKHFKGLGKRAIRLFGIKCKNATSNRMCRRCPAYPKEEDEKT